MAGTPRALIVSPASLHSTLGNGVTARRYAAIVRSFGAQVAIAKEWSGQRADLMIALHARKSAGSVERFRRAFPNRPIVLVLTGTDVYRDIQTSVAALEALRAADRLVVLQPYALRELRPSLRRKAVAIVQSAPSAAPRGRAPIVARTACVLGHLRSEKDPLRTAMALRHVPRRVDMRVVQAGLALDERYADRARNIALSEPRYRYAGGLTRSAAANLLRRSDLLVLSSRMEGGANVLSEAIAAGTPVLASRIPGNVGILGEKYPGYFGAGDTRALAHLLERAATDAIWYAALRSVCAQLRSLVRPARERAAWRTLLRDLGAIS